MASTAEVLLIILIIFVVILGVGSLVVLLLTVNSNNAVLSPPCDQGTTGLQDVSGTPCYKDFNGNCRLVKYSSTILNGSYLYPYPVSYQDVCANTCIGYVDSDGNCCASGDAICSGLIPGYNNCVATLAPRNCQGEAMPVAYDGNTLFYVGLISGEISTAPCECTSVI